MGAIAFSILAKSFQGRKPLTPENQPLWRTAIILTAIAGAIISAELVRQ
ncbi:hypothetical protein [Nostoc sp.]